MKLLLENFKKNMDERFRGPTDDPSFSDPGYNEKPGDAEYSDLITSVIDIVTEKGTLTLPNGQELSFSKDAEQYVLDGDVFANSFDDAEEELIKKEFSEEELTKMLDNLSLNEQKIKDLVKEKIKQKTLENLGAGSTNMAQERLRGQAGAAMDKFATPAVDRAIGLATKRLSKAPAQQKVDFLDYKLFNTSLKQLIKSKNLNAFLLICDKG